MDEARRSIWTRVYWPVMANVRRVYLEGARSFHQSKKPTRPAALSNSPTSEGTAAEHAELFALVVVAW